MTPATEQQAHEFERPVAVTLSAKFCYRCGQPRTAAIHRPDEDRLGAEPASEPQVVPDDVPIGERRCKVCKELYSPDEDYDDSICSVCVRAGSCCYIAPTSGYQCGNTAAWRICWGNTPDDFTESCARHVGEMLTDALEHRIYSLEGLNTLTP